MFSGLGLAGTLPELLRPHVHYTGDKWLDDAELAVNPNGLNIFQKLINSTEIFILFY